MATKKQKREAAKAKREAYLAELREEGLKAQARDHAEREAQAKRLKEWAADWNERAHSVLRQHGVEK